jgi:hypothetical protein
MCASKFKHIIEARCIEATTAVECRSPFDLLGLDPRDGSGTSCKRLRSIISLQVSKLGVFSLYFAWTAFGDSVRA